ncbi:putative bifunctional diguanylate cyclase/phosphodiesterase [Stagnihabitans tardus]|uniref:EAL domain-containing protein n=1 Tax=Stagnihabitans tardus TaxID=2699202 RepID=A0AAE4YB72_9RHOB|nr:EAL domain-containing protein [Stagnihabitans tardus]NBZ86445.1 EAL domain-containing protein [Stagnihabitans tardus]
MAWRSGGRVGAQIALGLGVILMGMGLRSILHLMGAELNYLPMLPTVVLASVFLRVEIGLAVVGLSTLIIHFVFLPGAGPGHDLAQVIYVLTSAFPVVAAELFLQAQAVALAEAQRANRIERLNAAVVEFSDDAIISQSTSDVVTSWNPAATRMLGYTASEMLGRGAAFLWEDSDLRMADVLLRLKGGARSEHIQTRLRTKAGGLVDVAMTLSLIRDPAGQVAGISIFLRDVTEAKRIFDVLKDGEERLRFAIDAARAAPWQWDCQTDLLTVSELYLAQHGLAPLPQLTRAAWWDILHPADRVLVRAAAEAAMAPGGEDFHVQYRALPPGGGMRWIEVFGKVERDASGRAQRIDGLSFDVTERFQALERVAYLAHHDGLTGLPNRALFLDRLERTLARVRRGPGCAVLLVDLDHFKEVNDRLGHAVGDALLCAVAARLRAEISDADTLARLGGDVFAILLTETQAPQDVVTLAERLIAVIDRGFELEGQPISVGTSIGIALAPLDGMTTKALLKAADVALYRAKADGSGCLRFFEPANDTRMHERRVQEIDLRRAWAAREFELFFQPIMQVTTRRLVAFEALLRWRHPERGLIQPDAFIPLLEEIGLILPVGNWVLSEACRAAMLWPGAPRVAVNLSPVQLAHGGLVASVAAALEESGLAAARLELEITETVMMKENPATVVTLERLKALGVRIAMDDFGAGYSSLRSLQRFPFDKVKIDRSFVAGLGQSQQSEAIVRAVTGMCVSLGITSTAEGVETPEQLLAVEKEGCTEVQGFLFSRPIPEGQVPSLIGALAAGDDKALLRGRGLL